MNNVLGPLLIVVSVVIDIILMVSGEFFVVDISLFNIMSGVSIISLLFLTIGAIVAQDGMNTEEKSTINFFIILICAIKLLIYSVVGIHKLVYYEHYIIPNPNVIQENMNWITNDMDLYSNAHYYFVFKSSIFLIPLLVYTLYEKNDKDKSMSIPIVVAHIVYIMYYIGILLYKYAIVTTENYENPPIGSLIWGLIFSCFAAFAIIFISISDNDESTETK